MTNSLIEILLILLLFISIQLSVFIRNRKARLLLLNLVPSILIISSAFIIEKEILIVLMKYVCYSGLFIYPFTHILLVIDSSPLNKKRHLLASFVISIPFLISFLIYQHISIILIMHAVLYAVLFVSLNEKVYKKIPVLLFMIFPALILFYYYNHYHQIIHILISLALITILISLFVFYEYSRRLHFVNLRLLSINNLNKRLNQVITRLRQSNDTLKKIISQKDIELLQIARHASLAEVTTGIAHELAQPLTGIKCISQNMMDDISFNDFDHMQAVSDLARISSLVDRSSSIIDHIRTFSRKRGFSFQQADLNACILNAIELINNQMKNSSIDLIFVLDDSVPRIYGDNLSLEQLFINLILNSKDAIISKTETAPDFHGVIKITTTFNENIVKLIIEDNGSGIPEDIIPKIWSPFFTTKQKGKGTGIGLSLSHRIIKEHNADVSINSSSEGTVFTIIFPVEQPHAEEVS